MQATKVQRPSPLQVFSALKSAGYRRYWLGTVASVLGFQIMTIAQGWLIYDLTGSKLYLGYVGLAAGLPAIVLNLFGGVVADKVNQRRLLLLTQSSSSAVMFVVATLTLTGRIEVWHLLVSSFLIGALQGFDTPTRISLFPQLIERKDMMNAVALNSMVYQGTRIIGPALGGVIIGMQWGVAPAFYAGFLGFLVMVGMIFTLRVPHVPRAQGASMLQDMAQGLGFIARTPIFAFLIGMTFFNSVFGMSYIFLLPVFAKDIFNVGASGLGYLQAASGAGALIGTLATAGLGSFQYKGWLLLGGAVLFGAFLMLFALASQVLVFFPLALVLLFLAGISTSLYMISVMTTLQTMVPDHLRGRVMGIYGMTYSLMPLGAMQGGAIAQYAGAPFAVGLGGAAVLLFALGMAIGNRQVRQLGRQAS
ncbi:MAG: MFS transporter [Dehalococcoidia bacterium]|nr:MFS transporter [Dehalococcoidia bacterium]